MSETAEQTGANDGGADDLAQLGQDLSDLQSAAGEGEGTETQQGKLTPEEHRERSGLGRKVASLEEKFDRILNVLEAKNTPERPNLPPVPPSMMRRQEETDGIPDIIATPEDVVKVLEAREKQRMMSQKSYEQDYIYWVEQNRTINPEEHEEVVKEMLTNFNRKLSSDPRSDAQYNYALALKSVMKKTYSKGKIVPNLKQDSTDGIGVSQAVTQDKSSPSPIKLSPEAEHYMRKTGRSAEWVRSALGADIPQITGKIRG